MWFCNNILVLIYLFISTELLTEEQKEDLKAAVDGLNSYLSDVQQNSEREREHLVAVVRERAEMEQQLKHSAQLACSQQSQITALQQVFSSSHYSTFICPTASLISCDVKHFYFTIHSFVLRCVPCVALFS